MAAPSVVPSNNNADAAKIVAPTPNATSVFAAASTTPTTAHPPKSLRGLNKPKCSKCGNVARSRCPYQCCKSCCAKAQNPCHIHVLKTNTSAPDKTSASSGHMLDQQATDVSTTGTSIRASSLRQLSNGSQVPHARGPLTRKEAAAVNQWRFSKLREYKDRNIETENEAFDRYMQNVSLLEEAFSVDSSVECTTTDGLAVMEPTSSNAEDSNRLTSGLKARVRSIPRRSDISRERIKDIVDRGLRKLQKWELNDDGDYFEANDPDGHSEVKRPKTAKNLRVEKFSAVNDLIDKLKKARSVDDLQSSMKIMSQFNLHEKTFLTDSKILQTSKQALIRSHCCKVEIDQEIVDKIDMHFASLDQIEDL